MKRALRIDARDIGDGHPAYIIAEIGSNHDGSIDTAKRLIKAAKEAGADAVKFQSFTAEGLVNPLKPGKDGGWSHNPVYELINSLTLPAEWHGELKEFCESISVTFLSAPFDEGRAELLEGIGVKAFKIASGDVTDERLLRKVASFKKPVILSTGASYMDEVERAVNTLRQNGCNEVAILHCSSLYPPSFEDINLRSMVTLKEKFSCPVGFSDHTPGSTLPVAAVALGGTIIEKHITYSRAKTGPDHPYAMEVDEFGRMVTDVRNLEKALGDWVKKPSEAELPMRVLARRGVYARLDIKRGERITAEMLKTVRQAYGLTPYDLGSVIGKRAVREIKKDMPVKGEDL